MNRQDSKILDKEIKNIEKTLAPCPFCGGEATIENTWTLSHWAECESCDVRLGDPEGEGRDGTIDEHVESAKRAAKAWNKRVK